MTNAPSMLPPSRGRAFRTKGLAYRAIFRGLERHLPDGRALLLRSLDGELRRFAEQHFLPGQWYDVLPIGPLSAAVAKLVGVPLTQYLRDEAALQASEDISGVYRLILSVLTPELAVSALVKLTGRYYDFGEARIEQSAPCVVTAIRTLVPAAIADWYGATSSPYMAQVLRSAGAIEPTVRVEQLPIVEGPVPVRDFRYYIRWTAP